MGLVLACFSVKRLEQQHQGRAELHVGEADLTRVWLGRLEQAGCCSLQLHSQGRDQANQLILGDLN